MTSAVVRLDLLPKPAVEVDDGPAFLEVVKSGFRSPRKQLRNSLAQGLGAPAPAVDAVLADAGIDGSRRPATLSLDEWAAVYDAWEGRGTIGSPGLREGEPHP